MFILHLLQYMLLNRASPKNVDSASAKKMLVLFLNLVKFA